MSTGTGMPKLDNKSCSSQQKFTFGQYKYKYGYFTFPESTTKILFK